MAKIKILQSIASTEFSYRPGEVVEIDDVLAAAWSECGTCALISDAPTVPATTNEAKPRKSKKSTADSVSPTADQPQAQ